MFGVGLPELAVLVAVAGIVAGPERLPRLARDLARMIRSLRRLADDARDELREVSPELADLDLRDLRPRALVQRQIALVLDDSTPDRPADPA